MVDAALHITDIAKVIRDARPSPALGPGPEWKVWSTIGEAFAQLLPTEAERDEFRGACQPNDPEELPPPPPALSFRDSIDATLRLRMRLRMQRAGATK